MSAASMNAAVLKRFGRPLVLERVPRPRLLDPGDVIVKVAGAGVCGTDVHLWKGEWSDAGGKPAVLPLILGHENTGWVEATGDYGRQLGFSRGDPVILHPMNPCGTCTACRLGNEMHCATGREPGIHGLDGGFAEYLRTRARCLVPLPHGTNPAPLAPLADAGLTAYHAVKQTSSVLRPGTVAVVIGLGGLGLFAVQLLARLTSARVIAVDRDEERLPLGKELGASDVVLTHDGMFAAEVLALVGDRGAEAVLDFVGNEHTPEESLRVLGRGGVYSVIGYGGLIAAESRLLVQRELRIQGNLAGSYHDLVELMAIHLRARLVSYARPVSLDQAPAAFETVVQGGARERVVLVPAGQDNWS
jgi:NAD+-dependent secondary alcohol dehydrogenase Adh1